MRAVLMMALLCACGVAMAQGPSVSPGERTNSYIELLRSDLRRQKQTVIAAGMELSGKEADVFWPIYREYEVELAKIGDQRIQLLREYGERYDTMTDDQAADMMKRELALGVARAQLKDGYFERFASATSGRIAARFFQIEAQVDAIIYLQFTSDLPLFPRPKPAAAPQ